MTTPSNSSAFSSTSLVNTDPVSSPTSQPASIDEQVKKNAMAYQVSLTLAKNLGDFSKQQSNLTSDIPPAAIAAIATSMSEDEFLKKMFQVLTQLSHNIGLISDCAADNQQDQANLAQAISKSVQTQTTDYVGKLKHQAEEQEKANSGFLGVLHKVFGNGILGGVLTALIGIAMCASFGGACLVALAAIPQMIPVGGHRSAMDAMCEEVAKTLGVPKAVVDGAVTIALTLGAGAFDAAAKAAVQAGVEETGEMALKEAGGEVGSLAKPSLFNAASIATGISTLTGTNLMYDILTSCKLGKDKAELGAMIANLVVAVVGCLAGAVSNGSSLLSTLSEASSSPQFVSKALNTISTSGMLMDTAGQASMNIQDGVLNINIADIREQIAPILAQMTRLNASLDLNNNSFSQAQKKYESLIKANDKTLSTDFAAAWEAAVHVTG
jgi:hypothetical protein